MRCIAKRTGDSSKSGRLAQIRRRSGQFWPKLAESDPRSVKTLSVKNRPNSSRNRSALDDSSQVSTKLADFGTRSAQNGSQLAAVRPILACARRVQPELARLGRRMRRIRQRSGTLVLELAGEGRKAASFRQCGGPVRWQVSRPVCDAARCALGVRGEISATKTPRTRQPCPLSLTN